MVSVPRYLPFLLLFHSLSPLFSLGIIIIFFILKKFLKHFFFLNEVWRQQIIFVFFHLRMILFFPLFLKDTSGRILGYKLYSFSSWKMSFHSLLAFMASDEKSVVIQTVIPLYMICHFFSLPAVWLWSFWA